MNLDILFICSKIYHQLKIADGNYRYQVSDAISYIYTLYMCTRELIPKMTITNAQELFK